MWKSACAKWLQKIACSFHVGNLDDLHTDRYYYKKHKSMDAFFYKNRSFVIKIWIYGENIKKEMLPMVVVCFIILTWWCQSFLMPRNIEG